MRKLEIIFPKTDLDEITNLLTKSGLPAYTVFKAYKGKGTEHGESLDFGFSGSQDVLYLIAICEKELLAAVIEKSKEDLAAMGAIVFKSDIELINM